MPSLPGPTKRQFPAEDAVLDLLIETLESLDRPARGQFLQRFLRTVAQLELTDAESLSCWEQILARRQEISESLGKPIPLKTAMVDVLSASNFLRVPILMEYEELKKLQVNAATDSLTGLYNRRLFEEYFDKELNRARRYSQHVALVIMDLHRFKEVNDRFGHPKGDQALQLAASTLRKSLRTSDYAFRIGGDEFALLLPQSDPEQAGALGRRVRAVYEAAIQPLRLDVPLSLDYGVAVYPEDGDQKEVLIRVADERLYQQKLSGRQQAGAAPQETARAPEPAEPPTAPAAEPSPVPLPPTRSGAERRKWERVSLAGTRAYAQLADGPEKTARVLDLGYGGGALETDFPEQITGSFHAVLHVPILPPVRVNLRRVYVQRGEATTVRMGCSFVS
ncbi:MAG TPA: GGDEF domain-containing protein [Candidatus Acidoferrales bacterium]|nr:GGDEF domain-containing protein [Candidatus Acidoferrales bacterium]